ncbi:hypothetical protein M9Y10_021977 [Tritrichomonas musculus]|uniref:non-specific serine/threonine protein kinase n=1 Tax=Tritrichomonas musculus TaxID=1915356 RepID=A0ABR2KR58_9EUKA
MEKKENLVTPDEERKVFEQGKKIGAYTIIRLIGQGGYGDIYEVSHQRDDDDEERNNSNTNIFAMKVEHISSPKQALSYEKNILKELKGSHFFPHLYYYGIEMSFHYLVMDLLGPSLSNTRRELAKHRFSLFTTLRLSVFMLQCIQNFHKRGYVHCDIKPGNFLLRSHLVHYIEESDEKNEKAKAKRKTSKLSLMMTDSPIVLIDYGLSRQFIDPNTNSPFPDRRLGGFVGTTKYASLNIHQGFDTSPRDDLASWIYSTVEMIDGKLPWSKTNDLKKTKFLKTVIPAGKLLESLPSQFIEIYSHVKGLSYEDTPNYDFIYNLLNEAIMKIGDPKTEPFDWEQFDQEKIHSFSAIDTLPKASDTQLFPEELEISRGPTSQSACCLLI